MNVLQCYMNSKCLNLLIIFLMTILLFSCSREDNLSCEFEITSNAIVIVPDIQIYTDSNNSSDLKSIVDFINYNKSNISLCLQTGDLTNNNRPDQWRNVFECYIERLYPEIPHYECLGNHDYGYNGTTNDRSSNIYWDISHNSKIYFGDFRENYVQFVQIGEEEYGILVLEFAVRSDVLEWAHQILKLYPDNKFIVLTHAFLNSDGNMYSESKIEANCDNPQSYAMSYDEDTRNSEQIFNTLTSTCSNLKYIICGHSLPKEGFKVNTQMDINGNPVKLIMVNFQHFENGGNGNIGILNVESLQESLTIYSTKSKECIINMLL